MENFKKYLDKFNLFEKLIAFFISISISYITIKPLLLHDSFNAIKHGLIYFFISLFLYFFISLFLYKKYIQLNRYIIKKFTKKDINIEKINISSFLLPSIFLAFSLLIIFGISIYYIKLFLTLSSDYVTYNFIAEDINSKYIPPFISIYIILISILQIINLSKIQKLKISVSVTSTILSLIVTLFIFFILTKVLFIVYWIIIIFTGPWVSG